MDCRTVTLVFALMFDEGYRHQGSLRLACAHSVVFWRNRVALRIRKGIGVDDSLRRVAQLNQIPNCR